MSDFIFISDFIMLILSKSFYDAPMRPERRNYGGIALCSVECYETMDKSQRGIALITVIVLIVVIFSFSLGLSVVIDKNLKFFNFISKKAAAYSLAKAAVEYITVKTDSGITWRPLSGGDYTTGEIQVDPDNPYYFEIKDTSRASAAITNPGSGEYLFIGIVKDRAQGREIARAVLKVVKPTTNFENSWTE